MTDGRYEFPDDLPAAERLLYDLIDSVQTAQRQLGARRAETRRSPAEWAAYNEWKVEAQAHWQGLMGEVRELRTHIRDLKHRPREGPSAISIVNDLVLAYREGRADDVLRLLPELVRHWTVRVVLPPEEAP